MNKLNDFLDKQEPGAHITLKVSGLEKKLTKKSADEYLQKLLHGVGVFPGVDPKYLDTVIMNLQTEIDIRLHNNQMLIEAIQDYQLKNEGVTE